MNNRIKEIIKEIELGNDKIELGGCGENTVSSHHWLINKEEDIDKHHHMYYQCSSCQLSAHFDYIPNEETDYGIELYFEDAQLISKFNSLDTEREQNQPYIIYRLSCGEIINFLKAFQKTIIAKSKDTSLQ